MKSAFLFDIDGCLTLPGHSKSILDTKLIDQIAQFDSPVAFVTGRSDGWLRQHYEEQDRLNYLTIPTYIEFGLARISNGGVDIQKRASDFLDLRQHLIEQLAAVTKNEDIYFEPQIWYDDYPSHDSLWVEKKHIQLSIAANSDVSTSLVHQLSQKAWSSYNDKARFLYHHLGVDVIPKGWSKAEATYHFISDLDETDYFWYVFGDNQSDREMTSGLSHVEFISTTKQASHDVRAHLIELDLL